MGEIESRWSPGYDPDPEVDPIDRLWQYLDDHLGNDGFDARRDGDAVVLEQDWLLHQCWYAHDLARQTSGVDRTQFTVHRPHAWDDFAPVAARFEPVEQPRSPERASIEEIAGVCRDHLPFPRSFGPQHCEFKCGDVTHLFREAIWQAFGWAPDVTKGAMYDPETNEGWAHGFIVVPPARTTDTEAPVILDGTARQFCEECADQWPATLAPVDEIGDVHVVGPDHPHRDHYALDRDTVTLLG